MPLAELAGPANDCAVARADRSGAKVQVRVVCAPPTAQGEAPRPGNARSLEIRAGEQVFGSARLPSAEPEQDLTVDLRGDAPEDLRAVLLGGDDIAADDDAPVVAAASQALARLPSVLLRQSMQREPMR